MTEQSAFRNRSIEALWQMWVKWQSETEIDKTSTWYLAFRMIRPQIPAILSKLDEDDEQRIHLFAVAKAIVEAIEEEEKQEADNAPRD